MTPQRQFETLFEGFQVTAIEDFPEAANQRQVVQMLGTLVVKEKYPLSNPQLTPGKVYRFVRALHVDWGNIGIDVLPERLKAIGARVISAPKSAHDLDRRITGGPYFVIEFEKDGHKGTILTRTQNTVQDLVCSYK